ncbi:hypothetical protein [Kitasatospora kifunensis]|uniref:Uncharacterized protein n=1 Tax=Kitasatospora kifunensis TaxID=58351 RepID=A0A7W7RBR6_KITKI|nr:hypothetical protein [Kitasatospora kifunensis]MBB4929095.1 hypothetical protein [Kitasatospora kifunensis]
MAHTLNSAAEPSGDDSTEPDSLLAVRPAQGMNAAAPRPISSAIGQDLLRTVGEAHKALAYLGALGEHDVAVSAYTALECTGSTQADALQAAADALRFADTLFVRGALWARLPDYRVTLLVSAIDAEFGDAEDPTHAGTENRRVVVYLDTDTIAPEGALTALHRQNLTQAGAFQLAADFIRHAPELTIEGLHWARVTARRRGAVEHRLTVLTASPFREDGGEDQPTYLTSPGAQP